MEDSALAAVTLGELADLIRLKIDGGYQQTEKGIGRQRLLAVVEELIAAERPEADHLLASRSWRIAEVRVAGIGGIASISPSAVSLSPTAGLTVVRGPNGHGKTSLARAIDCGLRGERDLSDEVAGELWTADLLTEGVEQGSVDLTLVSGEDRLTICVAFTSARPPAVTASLRDDEGARAVEVGEAWREALLSSRACYSYGALQNRLTENRALQGYLEELLILGPAWRQVRDVITTRAEDATRARKAVDSARRSAIAEEAAITARFEADDRAPVRPTAVTWPQAKDVNDVDAWLAGTGVESVAAPDLIRVGTDHEDRVDQLEKDLLAADASLAAAEEALDTPGMAAALDHIERVTAVKDLDETTCPLCGTQTDWRAHARHILSGVQHRQQAVDGVRSAVSELAGWVESELVPLLSADVPGSPAAQVSAFRAACSTGGHRAHSPAHDHARVLLSVLKTKEHRDWVIHLRATSDASAEWRAALSTIVHRFAGALREHGEAARESGAWRKAGETLDALQVEFRQRRQDAVTMQMHAALRRMLPDADIKLTGIQHGGGIKQRSEVEVGLTIGGREAKLGMLSSGQRNALLLTPLVILDTAGPFGFLVVDDPVHALDDTRVDLLAHELARLADERQVVVLTHDPRLEEHLRARRPDMMVIELHREPSTQTVTWKPHTTPWAAVLEDARQIHAHARADSWGYSEPLHSVVAGLCRAAVDGALRQAVITRAVHRGDNVDQALAVLGEARETRQRIAHVTQLAGGAEHLPCLEHGRAIHLPFWNRGAHGQLPPGVDLDATISAAAEACAELTDFDWSTP